MAMSKIKALQIWCKRTLDGYRDVSITDMTTSWRSGLAFCAMIHKYRPDLINYDSLDKENVYDNNKLAFDVAEKELGITALLEASDMVAMKVPDRLSVITYVAQYHNYFKDKPVLGGPGISVCNKSAPLGGGLKRHHEGSEPTSRPEVKRFTLSHENKQDKAQEKPKHQRLASMGETCQICGGKVYLLERQIDGGKLYHRSCFRHSDMSPSRKVYARPSVLSSRKDEQDREVKGMKALGNGFAAPSRRKSPERKSPRVALNMDTDSEPSIVSSHKLELADSKRNGHNVNELHKFENGSSENKIRSVGKKFEELEKPDWRNKRSQSPVTNLYNRPAERLADQPKLNGHSESTVKEKWPPVSDKKVTSDLSTDNGVNNTPKPRPRQSLQKADEKVAAESPSFSKSRNVESISDRTEANSALEELQKRRSSPRKLPLALQSTPNEITETEHSDFNKTNKKGNAAETTSRQRMFLKKNEQKNGSTEKLNKTMADRIKESKAKSNLRNTEEKSKISKESRTKGASREDLRAKSSSKEDLRMKGSSREDLATKSSSKEDLRMKTSSREDLRTKSSSKEGLRIKSSREDIRTKSSSRDDLTSNVSSRGGLRTPSRSVPSPDETSPPPLPRSTPPERPSVSPQSARVTSPPPRPSRSPAVSPTSPSPVPAPRSAPPKPPRTKQSSPVPMEVDVMTQASQWTPGSEPVAVMVYPDTKSPEEADQQVLGGLLKSLANVRQRPSEPPSRPEQLTETRPTVISPTRHKLPSTSPVKPSSNLDTHVAGNNNKNSQDKTHKVLHDAHSHLSEQKLPQTGKTNETVDTTPIPAWQKEVARRKAEKEAKSKQRPKSSTSILDYQKGKDLATESKAIVPQRERSRVPNIPAVDTTPAPALQKDVRRGKDKETRPPRPKSVEVLSDDQGGLDIGEDNLRVLNDMKKERKTQQNKKGKAALKSTEDVNKNVKNSLPAEEPIPDWQKEAQKRMEARKDNFVDPEKVRVVPEKHTNKKDKMPLEDELDKISASDKPNKISAITGKDRKQHHERPSTETHQNGTKDIHERHKPERHDRKKVDFNGKKNVANSDQHHQVVDTKSHSEENRAVTKPTKLKVSPGIKFNFDDNSSLESSTELSPRKGRQPPPRPKSPPHVNRALKHNRITPNKHTPPRIGVSPGKLSPMEIQRQLMDIDTKLTDLELKGRCLEDSIRNAQEDEEDVLMIDWFVLVSQKNDLVRQEADLIYAARENELEEEQDNVQDQLRQLLDKPDKTKEDKQEEEYLLGKLLDIVDQRSKIVDSIDDDKHRYEEEDREIAIVLEKKANRRSQERLL